MILFNYFFWVYLYIYLYIDTIGKRLMSKIKTTLALKND